MDKHWKQITPSEYAWEREALEVLRAALPDHEPYRAWANFEFIALDGSINEVDLLLTTPRGVFLIEIKSHPGRIGGNAGRWVWYHDGKRRVFDNPRPLAHRKAKKLAALLKKQRAAQKLGIPFIDALVFLSAENLSNELTDTGRQGVYTRRDILPALTEGGGPAKVDRPLAKALTRALDEAGIKESLRTRRVGLYELRELLSETDHWQEWRATHSETGSHRRIRIYLTLGRPDDEAATLRRAAQREFRLLDGIEHPGILHALDYQHHDHGPALVFDYDPQAVPLDHFILERGATERLPLPEALDILQQLAETVHFAHGRKLYHRALMPQSIYISPRPEGGVGARITNWATADREREASTAGFTRSSHHSGQVREDAGHNLALEEHSLQDCDPVSLDVFSLGTLAYLVCSGSKPAEGDLELQDKLSRGSGLLITDVLDGASEDLQDLVRYATHPDWSQRTGSAAEFLEQLGKVRQALLRPDNWRRGNPVEALPGEAFEGDILVQKRLGRGATAVAFAVEHQGQVRVLKLALSPEHNGRLRAEGETLGKLRHQAIVAYHGTGEYLGHTGLLLDYAAEGTVATRLRQQGPVQSELLERFGDDLLSALCHLEACGIAHRDIKPENLGLIKQGSQLHLLLFDFSLSTARAEDFDIGTPAYRDPFIRDVGRRRWDDYAERFSAALTLYQMATGTLPTWSTSASVPPLIDGELEIDGAVFDPSLREPMGAFFAKALARDLKVRFDNAEEMRRGWHQIFLEARRVLEAHRPTRMADTALGEATEATQIGLLRLSPQALDSLTRMNIHTVGELIRLPRNELVRRPGLGTQTRRELSEAIDALRQRLGAEEAAVPVEGEASVDQLFAMAYPRQSDAQRAAFLAVLGGHGHGADASAVDRHGVVWPSVVEVAEALGVDLGEARGLLSRVVEQWSKKPAITELRHAMVALLADHGGLMTAAELAEAILLRRGSVKASPEREGRARAVVRAAVETELARQGRWVMRRVGRRILVVDDRDGRGEALADHAEALGRLADDCARGPLLSPGETLRRVREGATQGALSALSDQRLLRLAVALSQGAALSSRAEIYPRGMAAEEALRLSQGALLGVAALTVDDVVARVGGRYGEAEPLPGRPALDGLMQGLELGFVWSEERQAYYSLSPGSRSQTSRGSGLSSHRSADDPVVAEEGARFEHWLGNSLAAASFLALSARPDQRGRVVEGVRRRYDLEVLSFDQLLLGALGALCKAMKHPPKWQVVLRADAAGPGSVDWANLQRLVRRALPAVEDRIVGAGRPVLLVDAGLIGRYGLVDSWLGPLRARLEQPLWLLIDSEVSTQAAVLDGVTIPTGPAGGRHVQVPSAWLRAQGGHGVRDRRV